MKKTAIILLLATALTSFAACSSSNTSDPADVTTVETTAATTTQEIIVNTNPVTTIEHDVKLNQDLTTLTTVVEASDPTVVEFDGYSAVTSGAEWQINSGIDYSLYDFLGTCSDLLSYIQD